MITRRNNGIKNEGVVLPGHAESIGLVLISLFKAHEFNKVRRQTSSRFSSTPISDFHGREALYVRTA